MKKRSCNIGYGCGGGCISVYYMCRKDYAESVSVSINYLRKAVRDERSRRDKEIDLRTSVEQLGDGYVIYKYKGKNPNGKLNDVEVSYSTSIEQKLGSIAFKINGTYEAREELSKAEKVESAKAVKRMVDRMLKSEIAEDTYISVTAHSGDGRMQARQKAYVNQGFNQEEGRNFMTARVSRGKFFPVSYKKFWEREEKTRDRDDDFGRAYEDENGESGIDLGMPDMYEAPDLYFSESVVQKGVYPDFRYFYTILHGEDV